MNSIILLSLFIFVCFFIIGYFIRDHHVKAYKQQLKAKSKKFSMEGLCEYTDALQEITLRLFTSHCSDKTTRFEKFNLAIKLADEFYNLDTSGDDFDESIKKFLDNKFAGELKYQSAPIFLDYRECRLYPIIYNNVLQALYHPLHWPLHNVAELSMILTTAVPSYFGDEYKSLLFEKNLQSLESKLDVFMESSLTLQIATDYSKRYNLPLMI